MAKSTIPKIIRICQVEGCERAFYAKRSCQRHYWQIKIHGKSYGNPKRMKVGVPNRHNFDDNICKIELCNRDGFFKANAIIDVVDYEKIKSIKWCLCNGYVQTYDGLKLHRFLLGLTPADNQVVDHKNRNPLDNRRSNLRICINVENLFNREKQKNNSSGFKGVFWDKYRSKWTAKITAYGKTIFIGRFGSSIEAAHKYDEAAKNYHGEFARLNFSNRDI